LVHNAQGPYLLDATKWPTLLEGEDNRVKRHSHQSHEENMTDNLSMEIPTEDEVSQGWVTSASKKKTHSHKTVQRKKVVVATRTSSRVPRDGVPIADKATKRKHGRDNLISGLTPTNPFTVLNSIPNDELKKVLTDLDIEVEDLDKHIDAFKAEELVRTDIAQAKYKLHLDRCNKLSEPHNEGDL